MHLIVFSDLTKLGVPTVQLLSKHINVMKTLILRNGQRR